MLGDIGHPNHLNPWSLHNDQPSLGTSKLQVFGHWELCLMRLMRPLTTGACINGAVLHI